MPLSAYPLAFLEALASETILPFCRLRVTPYSSYRPYLESKQDGYFVPSLRLALNVGSHYPPGL